MFAMPLVTLMTLVGSAPERPPARDVDAQMVAVETRVGTFLCNERLRPELERLLAGEAAEQGRFYAWAGD